MPDRSLSPVAQGLLNLQRVIEMSLPAIQLRGHPILQEIDSAIARAICDEDQECRERGCTCTVSYKSLQTQR